MTLPADTLRLYDASGASFAAVHFVLKNDPRKVKGDCIIAIEPERADSMRSEVRWLIKRRFEQVGEHKFRLVKGVLTIESGDFTIELHPEEEELQMRTAPGKPSVSAIWEP